MRWPVQKLVKESHGAGCVGQRNQPCHVNRRDQHSSSDAHRLGHVVVLHFVPVGRKAIGLRKYSDQIGRLLKIGLVFIRAQWS